MISLALWRARVGRFVQPGPRDIYHAPKICIGLKTIRLLFWITTLMITHSSCDQQVAALNVWPTWEAMQALQDCNTRDTFLVPMDTHIVLSRQATALVSRLKLCGDVELNPGPPTKPVTRQGRLAVVDPTQDGSLAESLADIVTEIRGLRTDMNSRMDGLEYKIDTKYKELEDEIVSLRTELDETKMKMDDLKNRTRRSNIVVYGVQEDVTTESWDRTEELLCEKLNEVLETDITTTDFERVHRLGQSKNKNRPIIAQCTNFKVKKHIMKAAREKKPDGLYVNEDFSPTVRKVRRELTEVMKMKREMELTAYLSYDKLMVKDSDNKTTIYKYDMNSHQVVQVKVRSGQTQPASVGASLVDQETTGSLVVDSGEEGNDATPSSG